MEQCLMAATGKSEDQTLNLEKSTGPAMVLLALEQNLAVLEQIPVERELPGFQSNTYRNQYCIRLLHNR